MNASKNVSKLSFSEVAELRWHIWHHVLILFKQTNALFVLLRRKIFKTIFKAIRGTALQQI